MSYPDRPSANSSPYCTQTQGEGEEIFNQSMGLDVSPAIAAFMFKLSGLSYCMIVAAVTLVFLATGISDTHNSNVMTF